MKNHIGTFAVLLPLALAGAGSALAAEADTAADTAPLKCSEATLRGTYLFATSGFNVGGKFKGPFAAAGYNLVDGRGHLRTVVSFSLNGKVSRFERDTGTYTVNADCTGTITGSDGTHYDIFVAPDGGTMALVETDPGTVSAEFQPRATARRVGD